MFLNFGKQDEASRAQARREREMAHAERLKAIEQGQSLPEVEIARAKADEVRAKADAAKVIVVSIMRTLAQVGTFGIAVGATAVWLTLTREPLHVVGLIVIWVTTAVASLAVTLATMAESSRINLRRFLPQQPSQPGPEEDERLLHAIQK